MPILAREADLYPDDLFEGDDSSHGSDTAHWWALYTLSRQEKELMRRLRGLRLAHYCPLVPRRTRSPSGRVRVSHVPLFPGYVFLRGSAEDRHQALTTNCVSRWLEAPDRDQLSNDLRRVQRLILKGTPLTVEARLGPGMRVRVKAGSFAGYEGTVIRRERQTRLLIEVRFLQQGVSFEIEDCLLERID